MTDTSRPDTFGPNTTPHHGLPLIYPSQAAKFATHNEALAALDRRLCISVGESGVTVLPDDPEDGLRVIIGADGIAEHGGPPHAIAEYRGDSWTFEPALTGFTAYDMSSDELLVFGGSAWHRVAATDDALSQLGIGATASPEQPLVVRGASALFDGTPSHRLSINRASAADTASVLFQTGFSGRAEIGLAGQDGLSIKTSPDGQSWTQALSVRTDGRVQARSLRSGTVSVGRDAVQSLVPPIDHGFVFLTTKWGNFPQSHYSAILAFDVASSPLLATMVLGANATNQGSAILEGQTGPDNSLNVSARTGELLLENRIDTSVVITYTFIG